MPGYLVEISPEDFLSFDEEASRRNISTVDLISMELKSVVKPLKEKRERKKIQANILTTMKYKMVEVPNFVARYIGAAIEMDEKTSMIVENMMID